MRANAFPVLTAVIVAIASVSVSAAGRQAASAPSPSPLVALLPIENLTGRALDASRIEQALHDALVARNVPLVDEATLRALMDRHRVRYTGGLYPELAQALREEAGVSQVVITSVERWIDGDPPALGLTARLVATEPDLRILWTDGLGVTGGDRPGFLDLGVVHDPDRLLANSVSRLADSLVAATSGRAAKSVQPQRRFRPRKEFRHGEGALAKAPTRVAVLPFTNRTERRRAGEIVALHFVRQLAQHPDVVVVEPGLVREMLLRTRLIPEGGIAFTQAVLLKEILGADLVVTGDVLDYVDAEGEGPPPVVDFIVQLLDANRRIVVWSSFSHNTGTDQVWFFETGRIRTAGGLGSAMALATVDAMLRVPKLPSDAPERPAPAVGAK